jgi:hypothetical protein
MYNFTRENTNLQTIRKRIAEMSDHELKTYGHATAWMAEHSSRKTWKVQLEEARAEWRRRHRSTAEATE